MQTLRFVTTNTGKIESLRIHISEKKYKIVSYSFDLPEIQANSAEEVVYEKAKVAYSLVKKPLLVHDSSFHIPALNDFPGVYVKYINQTIGVEGVLKLLKNADDRSCYFQAALAFASDNGIKVFAHKTRIGQIAIKAHDFNHPKAWSELWKVYIPYGHTKTMSAFTDKELAIRKNKKRKNEFEKFAEWLNAQK
jgi:XTP/dITP diphosphohydrolase